MKEKLKRLYNILFHEYSKTTITVLITSWMCGVFCMTFAWIVLCVTSALNIFSMYAANEGWDEELE